MREITEENLHDLTFDGIIVSVPKNIREGQHQDISFIFECSYFSEGKHGYPNKGHNPNKSSFFSVAYNSQYLPLGFCFNCTSRFTLENSFRFDSYSYYKFLNLEEFCLWYLQRKNYEIWSEAGNLKGKISNIRPVRNNE